MWGFVGDLVKAGSIGFVQDVVEHDGLFFVAKKKKLALRDSSLMLVQATDIS